MTIVWWYEDEVEQETNGDRYEMVRLLSVDAIIVLLHYSTIMYS
jgi:hypothetical protein